MQPDKVSFRSRMTSAGSLVRHAVAEMIGREEPNKIFGNSNGRVHANFGFYKNISTYDVSRTSYSLPRAIFYANMYKDRKTGVESGRDYLLGAAFGKPIVNIAAGFAVGSPVRVLPSTAITDDNSADEAKEDTDSNDPTLENVNQWLEEQRNLIYTLARNSFRDGDTFAVIDDDGEVREIPPEDVDIVQDPNNPDRIDGYDIWSSFADPNNEADTITYVDEIRRTYRVRMLIDKQNQRTEVPGTRYDYRNIEDGGIEEREMPVIHFANEKEGRMLYGVSDFQNLYYLMANYHAVLAAAIKGNIYNSTAVPVIQGVKNMSQFLKQNFSQDSDGNYTLKWDNQKMLVVGEGGNVQILQANGTAADASTILNILFWLISQSSETPEFAFGTAVQSSKASVSEQTPMLIKKAIRKQGQLEEPIRKLINLYIDRMATLKPTEYKRDISFTIDMPDILDEDLNINISIVNSLLDQGIITEETAMTMLNIGKYVKNFKEELDKARKQKEDRTPAPMDVFGAPINSQSQENEKIDEVDTNLKKEQIEQIKVKNKSVGEMLEKNIDHLSLTQIQEMNPDYKERDEMDPQVIQETIENEGISAFAEKYNGKLTKKQIAKYVKIAS